MADYKESVKAATLKIFHRNLPSGSGSKREVGQAAVGISQSNSRSGQGDIGHGWNTKGVHRYLPSKAKHNDTNNSFPAPLKLLSTFTKHSDYVTAISSINTVWCAISHMPSSILQTFHLAVVSLTCRSPK